MLMINTNANVQSVIDCGNGSPAYPGHARPRYLWGSLA